MPLDNVPSVFEVYRLSVGPGLGLTTGAITIGRAFRQLLLQTPYPPRYRILIEMLGNYASFGPQYLSDQAVIAGLGGYELGESTRKFTWFYADIKKKGGFTYLTERWAFNPESDVVYSTKEEHLTGQTIRFHLVDSDNNPIFQAEYNCNQAGQVSGPGIKDPDTNQAFAPQSAFSEIVKMVETEEVDLYEYVIATEQARLGITREQVTGRMLNTWKIMQSSLSKGLSRKKSTGSNHHRLAHKLVEHYTDTIQTSGSFSSESSRAALYAFAMTEELLDHQLCISAPTCLGAGIVPAVLKVLQEKFLFTDQRLTEGLLVGGLIGSLYMYHSKLDNPSLMAGYELAASAAMAVAAGLHLTGHSLEEIEAGVSLAFKRIPPLIVDNQRENELNTNLFAAISCYEVFGLMDMGLLIGGLHPLNLDETFRSILFS